MSRTSPLYMLNVVPSETPECEACRHKEDIGSLRPSPARLDDLAMDLARRGGTPHSIAHTMLTWASESAERAILWAAREDERIAADDREAQWEQDNGTDLDMGDDR
jgi:hypothetical protein